MSFRKVLIAIDDSLLGDWVADVSIELAHAVDAESRSSTVSRRPRPKRVISAG